ncbi:MAG: alanine--tRNA ligase [Planctomycetota bacterium]|nr:alanine--tRNA ligase [Planctomycetota bacterium]
MSQPKKVAEIREAFLGFFEAKEHLRLPSDSLIPSNDPTLLFTGAGMNQFKDEFLGKGRDFKRVTTSQKCLRVPDLENVGITPRHHTFFEMLGNFSFGDYFKHETIPWEWTFFTEVLGWDANRFAVTIFEEDSEAFDIWHDVIGIPAEKIYRLGEKENFWPASAPSKGPNGVCGPCSEIYWDMEPSVAYPKNEGLEELPDRFVEVGNCVFTQFNRRDGGVLEPLPQKNIDVGLGLERLAAVAQNAANNFETDLFEPILAGIQEASEKKYQTDNPDGIRMRRIADHARAVFFCIADGAMPGREGRGYVVRKILRRAVRDGLELGIGGSFLGDLLPAVQESMGEAYPELLAQQDTIRALVEGEESRFREVYARGIDRLETDMETQKSAGVTIFPGDLAFELHDTYGFPLDTSRVILKEHGFNLDQVGFDAAMEAQKQRARSGSEISSEVFTQSLPSRLQAESIAATDFYGYTQAEIEAKLLGILVDGALVDGIEKGQDAVFVFDQSTLYAEGGGQVGDQGCWFIDSKKAFAIQQTTTEGGYSLHQGKALMSIQKGATGVLKLNVERRQAAERHHTATHLLHAAMKEVVGEHVNQAGSKVSPEGLRFDYTHPEGLGAETIRRIEELVNKQVLMATPVEQRMSSLAQAKEDGVTALFGEKYGNEVRVVSVPGFSMELCGGCHVNNTGNIGPFRILGDRALAAGVRRIEAVAGPAAWTLIYGDQAQLAQMSADLKAPVAQLPAKVLALKEELREAKQRKVVAGPSPDILVAELQASIGLVAWKHLPDLDSDSLRAISDSLKGAGLPEVVLLTGGDAKSVPFLFNCQNGSAHKAGDLAKEFGKLICGGGGGRPDFAQGKGADGSDLKGAVDQFQKSLSASA